MARMAKPTQNRRFVGYVTSESDRRYLIFLLGGAVENFNKTKEFMPIHKKQDTFQCDLTLTNTALLVKRGMFLQSNFLN